MSKEKVICKYCGKEYLDYSSKVAKGLSKFCSVKCANIGKYKPFNERFVINEITGCHEWTGAKLYSGYGVIRHKGKSTGAHRVAWEMKNGPIPQGMFVCHKCDNPKCVNPDHLFIGTVRDNTKDMMQKGRHPAQKLARRQGKPFIPKDYSRTNPLGSSNSKLTIDQVKEIKIRLSKKESHSKIAVDYGVTKTAITHINTGLRWAFVQIE